MVCYRDLSEETDESEKEERDDKAMRVEVGKPPRNRVRVIKD